MSPSLRSIARVSASSPGSDRNTAFRAASLPDRRWRARTTWEKDPWPCTQKRQVRALQQKKKSKVHGNRARPPAAPPQAAGPVLQGAAPGYLVAIVVAMSTRIDERILIYTTRTKSWRTSQSTRAGWSSHRMYAGAKSSALSTQQPARQPAMAADGGLLYLRRRA